MNNTNRNENDLTIDANMENDYLFALNISENAETVDDRQSTISGCILLYI